MPMNRRKNGRRRRATPNGAWRVGSVRRSNRCAGSCCGWCRRWRSSRGGRSFCWATGCRRRRSTCWSGLAKRRARATGGGIWPRRTWVSRSCGSCAGCRRIWGTWTGGATSTRRARSTRNAAGPGRPGGYVSFEVHAPKRRLISAAPFRDRVVHHALHAVIAPLFERGFIAHSYANRVAKGTHRAVARYERLRDHHRYVLRGYIALFMGSFARGCVSPVAISGGTSSRPARTGVFSAASRASSRRRTPSVFSPTGALPSGHSRGVLVRCRGKGGRPAMAVTTGFQGRTFDVPRTCVPCIDPPRRAPCAAADAVFADAKAFLSSSEARQMSESELERELHRRGQELVRKLLQGHRDQRSPKEAAGPAEDTSGVECSEPREHESLPPKRPPARCRLWVWAARGAVTTACIGSMPR